jgi:hypothetical protein
MTVTMRYAHLAPEVADHAVKLLDGAAPAWHQTVRTEAK